METLLYGTVQSVSLFLMASGFSLVYGVSRLPNFAHGAIYVFAGYVGWGLTDRLSLPLPVAAAGAVASAALLGALLHRVALRRIRGMEISEVIATYAAGLALLEALRWLGLRGATFTLPRLSDGVVHLFGVPIDHQRVAVVVLGGALSALLWLATRHTRTGLAMRAVAQDERAAMMLGIDAPATATLAVAAGSALSAVAAIALLPLGSVVVQEGYKVMIYALAVSVVGGLGSWAGTVVASFVLGFSQVLAVAYGKPHYQMVVMMLAIVGTLVLRPSGFFGRQQELAERV